MFGVDFRREDFGSCYRDKPFRRMGPSRVEILPGHVQADGLTVEARLQAPGAKSVRVRYCLPHHDKALHIDLVVDKESVLTAEAVYVIFPLDFEHPRFHLDLNGVPLEPEIEQIPGSCRDWYGVHRWAEVSDGEVSVTLVPIDA